MINKTRSLIGILALAGACVFGEEISTNSTPSSAKLNLYMLFKKIPSVPSYEKTAAMTTNLLGSASNCAGMFYNSMVHTGSDLSERFVLKAHEVLHTPWNLSVKKSNYGEKEANEVLFYYCTEF